MPKEIAIFLELQDIHLYTGLCFRCSSATILVDSGGDLLTLKRHGGWKSSTVAESYIDESIANKMNGVNTLVSAVTEEPIPSTSKNYKVTPGYVNTI